ncbi:MAG: dipeptidase [Lewinellaceae bacterium]|nr:dipeptidase [Saprospiraceae bacterium]MCB9339239.1 dipeptidase [Lewinellaceae bacterium]
MKNTQEYIKEHKQRFLDELFDLLRIPSISADPKYKPDVLRCAEFVANSLKAAGCDKVEICPTSHKKEGKTKEGYPIIYGEKIIDKKLPTVLVYGHYDVQPPDPLDLWDSPPFEPVVKKTKVHPKGAIFARGSCDDKGQTYMHVKAFEAMVKTGELPCNVKFCVEGEEEVGSPSFRPFVEKNKKKLACDVVLCSDTSIIANDIPSITTGVRGLAYLEVKVEGPNRDLHSGVYGGAVANPANVLANMISKLIDKNGKITIPHFYDDVQVVGKKEREAMAKEPFNLDNYKADLGIGEVQGEKGYSTNERTSIRPSLDVNGIWGGYTGEGSKTVLPAKAFAKISMRLVPHQRPEKVYEQFEEYFKSLAPPSVKVTVTRMHGGTPGVTPVDTPEYKAAHMAMEKTFGKEPIPKREGGYIPIVALFKDVLERDSILIGFGLNSDAIHSPNEHYGLFNFYKGIETIPYYYQYYKELKGK